MARKSSPSVSDLVLQRLRSEESVHRSRLIELGVDHVLLLPLGTLIQPDALSDVLLEALREENVSRAIEDLIIPGEERLRNHFAHTQETVGNLIPRGLDQEAIAIGLRAKRPQADWIKGAVDPTPIRALMVPIVQETLLNFAKRLPIPGLNAEPAPPTKEKSGGLFGAAVRLGTSTVAGVGKAALGGVTSEIEKKIQAVTKDFANQAISDARAAIRAKLKSPEGQKTIQAVTNDIAKRILATQVTTILEDGKSLPTAELARLAPRLLEHNRNNPNLRPLVEGEIQAFANLYGDQTIGEYLESNGVKTLIRAQLIAQTDAPTRAFFESDAFGDWLGDLLASE